MHNTVCRVDFFPSLNRLNVHSGFLFFFRYVKASGFVSFRLIFVCFMIFFFKCRVCVHNIVVSR